MNLEFKRPATRFFEALPIGNGNIGAMVYGDLNRETLLLYHNTYFSGRRSWQEDNQENASDAFYEMRELCLKGEYVQAKKISKNFYGNKNNYGTNLPVGKICIQYTDSEVMAYHKKLDMEQGIVSAKGTVMEKRIDMEAFVSNPQDVLVYAIQSEGLMQAEIYLDMADACLEFEGNDTVFRCKALETIHSDGTCGVTLYGRLQVQTDGTLNQNKITNASYIRLFVQLHSDYLGETTTPVPHFFDYKRIRREHKQDFADKMKRVELQLPGIDQRIPQLFQYGRYLLLSSSRESSALPAHLQGIWNDDVACKIGWTCDMHLDINTQMNYYIADSTNLGDTLPPLIRYIETQLLPAGRITAQKSYGLHGFVAEIVSNAWGFCAPYWASEISPCPTGGVWLLTHLWEHFLYTRNEAFLKRVYPVFCEAAQFFVEYVFEAADGCYASGPSISPENSFVCEGEVLQISLSCTYEIAMIRELLQLFLCASEELNIENDLTEKASNITLPPYRVMEDGSIAEWAHDYPAFDPQHRHTSHLIGLYPLAQIDLFQTPELAKAAQVTINHKLVDVAKWEDTGWARAMLLLYAARLHNKSQAKKHIDSTLSCLLEENYMIVHPPTRGAPAFDNVYELDGNTGFTAGVCEMLLQSHNGLIQLLPCLPCEWENGKVVGLKARGAITVDMEWEKGTLKKAVLYSPISQKIKVRYKEETRGITLVNRVAYEWKG